MDVALFGAAGYTGLELIKLLAHHPHARLVCAASDTQAGKPIAPLIGQPHPLSFVTTAEARAMQAGFALLAVPPEPAQELAAALLARGARIVDLSHAHRATHLYGLTSVFGNFAFAKDVGYAHDIASTKLVANPGCYATCAITALAPIANLVDGPVAIAAGSGVTGAGRAASEEMSLGEMYGEVRAYKVLRHQHTPEIEAALARFSANRVRVVLTTHLLPVARGIFMTVTAKLASETATPDLVARYREAYAKDPTVVVGNTPEDVSLRKVVGTATCMVGVACKDNIVVVTAALDNLLKGAASQAIENMNLMAAWPRMAGLEHLARHG